MAYAYNRMKHNITGYSPNMLMNQRETLLSVDMAFWISVCGMLVASYPTAYEKAQTASNIWEHQNKIRYDLKVQAHDL